MRTAQFIRNWCFAGTVLAAIGFGVTSATASPAAERLPYPCGIKPDAGTCYSCCMANGYEGSQWNPSNRYCGCTGTPGVGGSRQ